MKRLLSLMLFVLTVTALGTGRADACACPGMPLRPAELGPVLPAELESALEDAVKTERDQAYAVFAGKVVARDAFTFTFEVETMWKGQVAQRTPQAKPARTLTMQTGAVVDADGLVGFSTCNFPFVAGNSYLVFAYGKSLADLTAGVCGLTRELRDAADTVQRLDRLVERVRR